MAAVVGRIMKSAAAPVGQPWLWTLAFSHHEDRTPTHGYEAKRRISPLRAQAPRRNPWRHEVCPSINRRSRALVPFANSPRMSCTSNLVWERLLIVQDVEIFTFRT